MRNITIALWAAFITMAALWLAAEPTALSTTGFFPLRNNMVQLSGILAMTAMSLAMVLALRPRWPEGWLGGLDKMYRLHKWLGIAALSVGVVHWLWAKGPKWATGWGWLERPARGPRPVPDSAIEQTLGNWRGLAEGVGEWAFYAIALLIVLALLKRFPYRRFFQTHRLLAVAYLVMVFHAVVLTKFTAWTTPLGVVLAGLLAAGTWAALVVLTRRVAAARRIGGTVEAVRHHPALRTVELDVIPGAGWAGHQAGQFAFVTLDADEGAHPFTIASAWNADAPCLTFLIKELGDHTRTLRDRLRHGQTVTVEGPYGRFTFADPAPRQIWIGGGIGITPFLARLQHLAHSGGGQNVDLFACTADHDPEAEARLRTAAAAAGIRLHVLLDSRDGRLDGDRIRELVPAWRDASLWFCGPAAFGQTLRADFAAHGLSVSKRFHQELFALR